MAVKGRVLLVEDDANIRHVLSQVLSDESYEVREAVDGETALDALQTWTPSLIVLDLMMPRMDGWKFRSLQRQLDRAMHVPVLVLSANRNIADAEMLTPAGVLTKPFDLNEVVRVVDALHGRQRNA